MTGMVLPRWLRYVALGALAGLAVALGVWRYEQAAIAAGENPAGVGFGVSHLLFFVSLPWSVLVWGVMVVVGDATGADGPAFLRPFFYAMPAVAGAGWGWIASLRRRRAPERSPS